MCLIIALLLLAYLAYRIYQHLNPTPDINPQNKFVLISGCDSGFGRGLAIELDKQQFHVFAGVYSPTNIDELKKVLSSRATVFKLDITQQDEIDSAYTMISNKTKVLHALVNNAGIGTGGLIDWITVESMRQVMDVNFFGHVSMTKKFLPLLIAKEDSRVVNLCSVAGYLTKPGMSSYAASKYALESFSDCLRREMAVWKLRVSIIEPGFMRTAIIKGHDTAMERLWDRLPTDVQERWGAGYLKKEMALIQKDIFMNHAEDPSKVVQALKHAVMNTVPHIRYRPGIQSSYIMFPLATIPAWITDFIMTRQLRKGILPAGLKKQLPA